MSAVRVESSESRLTYHGEWNEIRFAVSLVLARTAPAWFWHVELLNTGGTEAVVDLIYTQDVALAHYGAIRMNEYYVSQYVDHTPLMHSKRGAVLGVRQNLSMSGQNPWLLLGSLHEALRLRAAYGEAYARYEDSGIPFYLPGPGGTR